MKIIIHLKNNINLYIYVMFLSLKYLLKIIIAMYRCFIHGFRLNNCQSLLSLVITYFFIIIKCIRDNLPLVHLINASVRFEYKLHR